MTDHEINLAMADAMGWSKEDGVYVWTANGIDCTCDELWDWVNDLNAMHLTEKILSDAQWEDYIDYLANDWGRLPDPWREVCHSTARQRAEAFLRTLGKWEEVQS
jgi:hypothetical protein